MSDSRGFLFSEGVFDHEVPENLEFLVWNAGKEHGAATYSVQRTGPKVEFVKKG